MKALDPSRIARILVIVSLALALTGIETPAAAQLPDPVAIADSLAESIRTANLRSDLEAIQGARTLASRALAAYPDHPLLTYYLAATYYREATLRMEEDADQAQALLEQASEILEDAVESPDAIAESYALRSSVLGMRITNIINAMTLGRSADEAIDHALEVWPDNPRVWLTRGIGTLHKPSFLGGGSDAALEQFNRAVELFETDNPAPGHPTWGAAEVHVWIGIAHTRADRASAARVAFDQALQLEPGFAWARILVGGR